MSEKLQILNMVQEGKITAEEGVKLLEALEDNSKSTNNLVYSGNKAKWLKVRVFDPNDATKVNVTLPVSLINIGVKLAGKFSPEFKAAGLTEEDMEEIFAAIQNGQMGKIVDVDSEDGTRVEVVIE
ncbi:hypothetical protein RBU61_17505 [Tissierella sp. MB52-C2]|uniref:SHOCT-like domain-containing protein n=1 Tax=Tissierella sp. MB52-C2 TaxID=3070999 RepID=UPI00280A6E41|nr:hypothetical protein [Tissierella sp. MB52-C2]WMM24701.1 hypothetical protein RBU61_17505 [Tissierella sp. MB52-C2]